MGGIEEICECGENDADGVAAFADQANSNGIGFFDGLVDITQRQLLLFRQHGREAHTLAVARQCLGPRGDGPSASKRFETAAVAAVAKQVMSDIDMADLAGVFSRAAVDFTVAENAGADAVADFHKDHVGGNIRRVNGPFAQDHRVNIVVDIARTGEVLFPELADRIVLPARHDGQRRRQSGAEADRAREPHSDALDLIGRDSSLLEKTKDQIVDMGQDNFRALTHVQIVRRGRCQNPQAKIGHRDIDMGRFEIDSDNPAAIGIETIEFRLPAAT